MTMIDIIYRQVISVERRVYGCLGNEYLPNVILLGREEWLKLKADHKAVTMLDIRDYDNPKFMGIPIEVLNKSNYFRVAYQYPLYDDKQVGDV
jgi:hypothetical protein